MIYLKNLTKEVPAKNCSWQVRVDRGYSILANPYKLKTSSETERQLSVARYKRYFHQRCQQKDKLFLEELYRLYTLHQEYGKLELFCWCYPKLCHADVIKTFLENFEKGNCYEFDEGTITTRTEFGEGK